MRNRTFLLGALIIITATICLPAQSLSWSLERYDSFEEAQTAVSHRLQNDLWPSGIEVTSDGSISLLIVSEAVPRTAGLPAAGAKLISAPLRVLTAALVREAQAGWYPIDFTADSDTAYVLLAIRDWALTDYQLIAVDAELEVIDTTVTYFASNGYIPVGHTTNDEGGILMLFLKSPNTRLNRATYTSYEQVDSLMQRDVEESLRAGMVPIALGRSSRGLIIGYLTPESVGAN